MPSDHDRLIVYLDGEFVPWSEATVHVFSPLVKYGAGVFETAAARCPKARACACS